jgi:prophage regulatory protein
MTLQRFIRKADLPDYVGLKRTQIYELMKAGDFPRPIQLTDSGVSVAWLESEVLAWQAERIAKRAEDQAARNADARLKRARARKRRARL